MSFAAAALVFGLRLGRSRLGVFALALIASRTVYLLTYFPLNVSAEYRYFYWCGYAAYLGLLCTLLAWLARRRQGVAHADATPPLPGFVRLTGCVLSCADDRPRVRFGRVAARATDRPVGAYGRWRSGRYATQHGVHSPLDGHPARGANRRTGLATPGWAGLASRSGRGTARRPYRNAASRNARPSRDRPGRRTGPDRGWGFSQLVDTRAAERGEVVLDLSPHGRLAERPRHLSWHAPARALFWTVVLTALLFRLGRERRS
ncbi:hypothetical protein [Thauera humireducens]|uniref:hypothetical protein n=1 Tax=Thauera humireducens TaxID=1134435 RepID=UPI00311DDAB6